MSLLFVILVMALAIRLPTRRTISASLLLLLLSTLFCDKNCCIGFCADCNWLSDTSDNWFLPVMALREHAIGKQGYKSY
jgi:hypothetical protein